MKRAVLVVVSAAMSMGAGCFFLPGGNTGEPALRAFQSAAELADFLNDERDRETRGGGIGIFGGPLISLPLASQDESAPPSSPTGGADAADGDFSTTTIQEVGVDEGDLVKNDGTYVYVLKDSQVRIVQAQPADSLAEVASVDLEGNGVALYLRDDQLIALTSSGGFFFVDFPIAFTEPAGQGSGGIEGDVPPATDDISILPDEPQVRVTVIDITDRQAPNIVRTVSVEGNLVDSRLIDGQLHLVLQAFPNVPVEPLTEAEVPDLLPTFEMTTADGDGVSGRLVEPTDVLHPIDPSGITLTTVSTIDVDTGEIEAISVVGGAETLYASTQALYLSTSSFSGGFGLLVAPTDESTDVHKIALTETGPSYVGSGKVPGRPLDQYSFSEYQDHLRVATTSNAFTFDGESSNNVYVMREANSALSIVGQIEGIAPGERIFSARFVGDRGYLVTFVQIDPLFTLDLSDPENPTIVGELKIPGFSTFLLPISDTELLAVGRDATDEGLPLGVQLSLFDVSDFANPALTSKVTLGLSGSFSEALDNPKAFTYFASQRLVALPVSMVETGSDGFPGGLSFSGLVVYRVDPTEFVELGRIETSPASSSSGELDFIAFAPFTRGVFLGSDVFAVTPDLVRGAPVSDVNSVPYSIDLE